MHVYVELVKKEKEHDSDSESENEIVNEEHIVNEVEVNMNNFKFQINEEDESSGNVAIVPNVNVREDNLVVLDFDSLKSDLEDVPKNGRSLGFRKLKKKHTSSKFFIGREFANRDLAKDLIRDHAIESRRNLHFLRNDKRRIKVVCNCVVPSKNVIIDKVQGSVLDIFCKGKLVNEDAEEDKSGCPWLLYLSKGDKGKQMLTVVGVDANNGIYPVAYGIVESENQYSWTWFLKCLGDDFDLYSNSNFTFITHRQKGLLPALAKLFPSTEHRDSEMEENFGASKDIMTHAKTHFQYAKHRQNTLDDLEDGNFEPLFGEGPSKPVVHESPDESPVEEGMKRLKSRPVGRDKTKRMGSTSAARSTSSAATDTSLVDMLLNNFTQYAAPIFSSRKEASSEYLKIKERELEMQD
uniref:MULE transposase domain-containing protein n=1 Tax=Tanacetum cinerariifolium TaxID=118510 RepID=A0A6L2N3Q9_TANCI|nr:hypothetical protein [Tanacetum cinerariifolium]